MENIISELKSNSGIIAIIVAIIAIIVTIANIIVVYRGNMRLWRVQIRPYLSFEIRYVMERGVDKGHALCCRNIGKGPAIRPSFEINQRALKGVRHAEYISPVLEALSEKDPWKILYFIDDDYSVADGVIIRNIRYKNMNEEELTQPDVTLTSKSYESPV